MMLGLVIYLARVRPDEQYEESDEIFEYFPSLPGDTKVIWATKKSGGIGLKTIRYIFVFYEKDMSESFDIGEKAMIDSEFRPKSIAGLSWYKVNGMPFAFQDGKKDNDLINTSVYISDDGKVLYFLATSNNR